MMNTQSTEAPTIQRSNWVVLLMLLLCCAMVSDVNIQVVIAQEAAPASATAPDDGVSPSPDVVAPVPADPTPASPGDVVEPQALAVDSTSEPAPASEIASQEELNTIPAAASESISDIARAANDAVRNLSVEPGSRPLLPKDRPSWVGAPADLSTKNHMLSVGSIPMLHARDVDSALDEPLVAAVHNYIDEHIANAIGAAASMPVDAEYIRRNLIDDPQGYVCELSTSEGPMHQKWVRVRITPEQRDQFQQWHIESTQRNRMGPLGAGLAATFLMVGLTHMLLRTRHGVTSLPLVNQSIPNEQVATSAKRGLMLPVLFVIGALLLFGLAFVGMMTPRMQPVQYPEVVEMESWPDVPESPKASIPRVRVPRIEVIVPEVRVSAPR